MMLSEKTDCLRKEGKEHLITFLQILIYKILKLWKSYKDIGLKVKDMI